MNQFRRQSLAVEIEMEEITKAIDMAIVEGEKCRMELFAANELFLAAIINGIKRPLSCSVDEYLPDLDGMLRLSQHNSIENGIVCDASNLKSLYDSTALCFGEHDDAMSLIEDNEQLRVTYVCVNVLCGWSQINLNFLFLFQNGRFYQRY